MWEDFWLTSAAVVRVLTITGVVQQLEAAAEAAAANTDVDEEVSEDEAASSAVCCEPTLERVCLPCVVVQESSSWSSMSGSWGG